LIKNKNILGAGNIPALRIVWLSIGMVLTGVGMVGIIVPGLPTTIFMILAAGCFFRSSTKMYHWVVSHPLFGDQVLRFREGAGMPKKAKYLSIVTMWAFIMFAVFIGLQNSAAWIKYFIVLSGAMGTLYIISQPNLKK
jgi:hypothetical protein